MRFGKGVASWITSRDATSPSSIAEGTLERLPDLAHELVSLQPDVLVVMSNDAIIALGLSNVVEELSTKCPGEARRCS